MKGSEAKAGMKAQGLFDRLPSEIFRPLAAPNRERYWRLLVRLNDLCFGPDAPGGMEEGLLHGYVTAQIEDALTEEDGWHEERESAGTPLNNQANMVLATLVESGWLKEERRGLRRLVRMSPTVQKFLEGLKRFGEEGPMFVAGKVQVIYTQLQAIAKNPKDQAHAFQEVSEQAQSLISMLNGTAARVREVMDQLRLSMETPEFVEGFFAEYVANLFLKDYQSLRTDNHPLRFRHDVVLIARSLRDVSENREALLVWYRSNYPRKPGAEVEAIFERDVTRLLRFNEVERYLDRLDDAVSAATRQALSFLHYRLRSQGKIDRLIELSVSSVLECHELNRPIGWTFGGGVLFYEQSLRPPKAPKERPKANLIRRPKMTHEQIAASKLRQAMTLSRRVTKEDIDHYINESVTPGQICHSETLPISSVRQLSLFLALSRAAFLSTRRRDVKDQENAPLLAMLSHVEFITEPEFMENDLVSVRKFSVRRKTKDVS